MNRAPDLEVLRAAVHRANEAADHAWETYSAILRDADSSNELVEELLEAHRDAERAAHDALLAYFEAREGAVSRVARAA